MLMKCLKNTLAIISLMRCGNNIVPTFMQYINNALGILIEFSLPILHIYRAILKKLAPSSDTVFVPWFSNSLAIAMQFSTQYPTKLRLLDFISNYFRIGVFYMKSYELN